MYRSQLDQICLFVESNLRFSFTFPDSKKSTKLRSQKGSAHARAGTEGGPHLHRLRGAVFPRELCRCGVPFAPRAFPPRGAAFTRTIAGGVRGRSPVKTDGEMSDSVEVSTACGKPCFIREEAGGSMSVEQHPEEVDGFFAITFSVRFSDRNFCYRQSNHLGSVSAGHPYLSSRFRTAYLCCSHVKRRRALLCFFRFLGLWKAESAQRPAISSTSFRFFHFPICPASGK